MTGFPISSSSILISGRVNNRPAIDANINTHNQAARVPMVVPGWGTRPSPVEPDDRGNGVAPRPNSGCAIGGLGGGDALLGAALLVGLLMRRRSRR